MLYHAFFSYFQKNYFKYTCIVKKLEVYEISDFRDQAEIIFYRQD